METATLYDSSASSALLLLHDVVRHGIAQLLLSNTDHSDYYNNKIADNDDDDDETTYTWNSNVPNDDTNDSRLRLFQLAKQCRMDYRTTGIAHIPHFINHDIVELMKQEALHYRTLGQCFYSTESHTVYQLPLDITEEYDSNHPRNVLQQSSKWIIDYNRLDPIKSPLSILYQSPHLRSFVAYVVNPDDDDADTKDIKPFELYVSGCPYNAAYYNIYEPGDGLGWHFDSSSFGVALELQTATPPEQQGICGGDNGGHFELCYQTRSEDDIWSYDNVRHILEQSTIHDDCSSFAQRIHSPAPVGSGSLIIFAGKNNLHRVTPVRVPDKNNNNKHDASSSFSHPNEKIPRRINAIMTYETLPNQTLNPYSLHKFFGR
jgi:hypothetical protein